MTCDVSCPAPPLSLESGAAESGAVITASPSTWGSSVPVADSRTLAAGFRMLTAEALAPASVPDATFLPPSVSTSTLVQAVSQWENIRLAPQARQAVVFLLGDQEVGAVQSGGLVTIPFPAPICETLTHNGTTRRVRKTNLAVTIHMRTSADVRCAAFLLHLSHLYRAIIASRSLRALAGLEAELSQLHLPDSLLAHYDHAMEHKAAAFA